MPLLLTVLVLLTTSAATGVDTTANQEDIRQAYQRYLTGESLTYDEKFDLARKLARTNLWPEAIEVYTTLLSEHPDDPDSRLGRGLVYAWRISS